MLLLSEVTELWRLHHRSPTDGLY